MLSKIDAQPNLPVKDLEKAKPWYEHVLGLEPVGPSQEGGVQGYRAGATVILVYQSQFAGTNRATAVTWSLGDKFDKVVKTLKARGVTFESYDMPGETAVAGVYAHGAMRVAWFKDPDGNIINIGNYPVGEPMA